MALLLFSTADSQTRTGGLSVIYISPLPASGFQLPAANLIFRTDRPIGTVEAKSLVRAIIGSRSGSHAWSARVSDDGRTVTCRPSPAFAFGETVTVAVDTGALRWTGLPASGSYSIGITAGKIDPGPAIDALRAADFPPSVSADRSSAQKGPAPANGTPDVPAMNVSVSGVTAPGYLFLSDLLWSTFDIPALLILQNDGTPVFARDVPANSYDFKPQPDGTLTYYDDGCAKFLVMDSSMTVIDTIGCENGYATDPHELRILPNGHALLLGVDMEAVDMSRLVPGGSTNATVLGAIIQELDRNRDVVFQWRSWDHFNITDAEHIDLTSFWIDYVHANALDVDTDGNILLSSRHMNEVTKISRQTGAIIWRLGGMNNQYLFVNDSIGFSYQHAVRRIANGHITMFDNGDFHVPPFSRAVEYALDEVNKTATLVWQYRDSPDVEGYAMGYVQRLENGNTLIGWGAGNPTVTEVAPDGSKLYEMTFPEGVYSYRAFRYDWQPVVASVPPAAPPPAYSLAQNYPNPFNPATTITFSIARDSRVRLDLFNIIGQRVVTLLDEVRPAGTYSVRLDGSQLASGVYLYRLEAGTFTATKKLVLMR